MLHLEVKLEFEVRLHLLNYVRIIVTNHLVYY